jgi:diaminobutyrate-2-oxoglutarate transaminase
VVGARLRGRREATAEGRPALAAVRGRGLMLGVEMVDPDEPQNADGSHPADADLAVAVQRACFDRGLVVERGGRAGATVRFLPPLVITDSEVDEVGDRFDAAVDAALAG